ncbi:MAG TPA: HEAT repeat domain-containing protein [Lacipirellulaceae bacterium]|nr:HEAT repeat domain-containing protein [Lacipirellulaceae bacterium]
MTNRPAATYGVWTALAIGCIVFMIVEPTGILRGIARREAFFHSRPSSYWRNVFREEAKNGGLSDVTTNEFTDSPYGVSVLKECYLDSDPSVRENAILLLWRKTYGSGIEEFLATALQDEHEAVQLAAAQRLQSMDKRARGLAYAKLASLASSTNDDIALEAIRSMWWVDKEAALKVKPWYKFESARWQVSAKLPVKPEESYLDRESRIGVIKMHAYFTPDTQPLAFGVVVYEIPPDAEQLASVERRYKLMAELSVKQFKEKGSTDVHVSQHPIDISGHGGVAIEADDGEKWRLSERMLILGPRGYLFLVAQSNEFPLADQELEYFFDSCDVTYDANKWSPGDESHEKISEQKVNEN